MMWVRLTLEKSGGISYAGISPYQEITRILKPKLCFDYHELPHYRILHFLVFFTSCSHIYLEASIFFD